MFQILVSFIRPSSDCLFRTVSNDSMAISIMAIVPPRSVPAITGYVITPSSSWNGKDSRGRHAASNFVFLVGASGSPS